MLAAVAAVAVYCLVGFIILGVYCWDADHGESHACQCNWFHFLGVLVPSFVFGWAFFAAWAIIFGEVS